MILQKLAKMTQTCINAIVKVQKVLPVQQRLVLKLNDVKITA